MQPAHSLPAILLAHLNFSDEIYALSKFCYFAFVNLSDPVLILRQLVSSIPASFASNLTSKRVLCLSKTIYVKIYILKLESRVVT